MRRGDLPTAMLIDSIGSRSAQPRQREWPQGIKTPLFLVRQTGQYRALEISNAFNPTSCVTIGPLRGFPALNTTSDCVGLTQETSLTFVAGSGYDKKNEGHGVNGYRKLDPWCSCWSNVRDFRHCSPHPVVSRYHYGKGNGKYGIKHRKAKAETRECGHDTKMSANSFFKASVGKARRPRHADTYPPKQDHTPGTLLFAQPHTGRPVCSSLADFRQQCDAPRDYE